MLNNFRKRHAKKAGAESESGFHATQPQSGAARREVKLTPKSRGFLVAAASHSRRTSSEDAHGELAARCGGKHAAEGELECAPLDKNTPKLCTCNSRSIWRGESMTSSDDDVIDEQKNGVNFEMKLTDGAWELPRCRSATIAGTGTTTTTTTASPPPPPPPHGQQRRLTLTPPPPRRHAICTELEKFIVMENGENLCACHKRLIIKDYLQGLRLV